MLVFLGYFAAYFLSVQRTEVVSQKGEIRAVPVYAPFHAGFVSAVFAPAHFMDAQYFRRACWETQIIFGADGLM